MAGVPIGRSKGQASSSPPEGLLSPGILQQQLWHLGAVEGGGWRHLSALEPPVLELHKQEPSPGNHTFGEILQQAASGAQ